ncbi:MAG: ribosomal protein S18-alanine N-acetyltransferase [Defluviitaleaceae bacterium]|nr:ribosomal protein S18-alanine N-acetyltransferase [Defluviitaleaceae bacterium]
MITTPKQIVVLPATLGDLDAIEAIEQDCFSTPWSRETLAIELSDANIVGFVARGLADSQEVLGYTFMRHGFSEGHIENIAVSPAAQRCGIASYLIEALLTWARENALTSIMLEVRQGNRAAMALYHKYGFKIEGYRRAYYTDPPEDAVLMRNYLEESYE